VNFLRQPLACLVSFAIATKVVASEAPVAWGDWPRWGDQGDGTYRNPVLPADYSDLDCIREGADYYAISSTFQFSPGVVILHSRDLVNWQILGHVVSDITEIAPEMNWDRMDRYGNGIWAGAIRHHAGKFRVYFGTPQEGFFMSTAENPGGPWTPLHPVLKAAGWDDCCPFWDDDGQGYFVCTQFAADPVNGKKYNIHLFKLTPDGRDLLPGSDTIIHQSQGSEANKLYKINGLYYHLYSEVKSGQGRVVMMDRSKNLTGPYETRQLSNAQRAAMEPNQGGLVQTETGGWFFLTHHGSGSWEGRAASLLPVTWIDGWPILGAPDANGIGNMVWSSHKPLDGLPVSEPQTSDGFDATTLAPQWEWNYQPRAGKWSLTARPGYLRLQAFRGLDGGNLLKVGNTLTQRAVRAENAEVTVSLQLDGLADGQHAGLSHFSAARKKDKPAANSASIGVAQSGATRFIEFSRDGDFTRGPAVEGATLWLRSTWGLDGLSRFSFSTDGRTFTPFGEPYQLAWGAYRGDRIGLFTFNNTADAGQVDFDWFHYDFSGPKHPDGRPKETGN
jgi:beta-xylosidase